MSIDIPDKARKYSNSRYALSLIGTVYLVVLLFIFQASGLSVWLAESLRKSFFGYLVMPAYLLVVSLAYYTLEFPLNFYQSFILEHKFSLTKQKLSSWFVEQFKAGLISFLIGLILFLSFYYILNHNPNYWWLISSLVWIFFSLVLAKLTPVIIIPLFFKYKPYSNQEIKTRVFNLAQRMKVKILDVFEIDFSKKTLKANAAFVGWGSTRRVLLADTLQDKYSADEIEVILAHEFAHYKLKHLLKLVVVNAFVTIAVFYLIFKTSTLVLESFSLSSLADISALPIILLYFVLFGIVTQPIQNLISRIFEREADAMALKITGLKEAFISTMDKLANQNLSDRKPNPVIKAFFFDHPPIDERINLAKKIN